jgi:hypothetical protein
VVQGKIHGVAVGLGRLANRSGGQILNKKASEGEATLTEREKLIYEIWLLDTETRNGGISQYFANWGLKQWERCHALATTWRLPSFLPFAKGVSHLLTGNADPYLALITRQEEADKLYSSYQTSIVKELRESVEFLD